MTQEMTKVSNVQELEALADSLGFKVPAFSAGRRWECLYINSDSVPWGGYYMPGLLGMRDYPAKLDEGEQVAFALPMPNEVNYWVFREALRFLYGIYKPMHINWMLNRHGKPHLWWHFPHQSVEDPTMIAYTPSQEYGVRDRQVRVKIGRYLTQFYGDVLSEDQIRSMVNNSKALEIQWAYGGAAIREIYENGPSSCMAGTFDYDRHPVEAYGYQWKDGRYEFGLAYLTRGGGITARAIVALRPKLFTSYYGDDGTVLSDMLKEAGFHYKPSLAEYDLRLSVIPKGRSSFLMPYLDGDIKYVSGPRQGVDGEAPYFLWDRKGSIYAGDAEGVIGDKHDGQSLCWQCDEYVDEDEIVYSEYHDRHICEGCCGALYRTDVRSCNSRNDIVHEDSVVYCNSDGTYYADDAQTREHYDLVEDDEGEIWFKRDCRLVMNDYWVHKDDAIDGSGGEAPGDWWVKYDEVTVEWFIDAQDNLFHPRFVEECLSDDERQELEPIWKASRSRVAGALGVQVSEFPWFTDLFVVPASEQASAKEKEHV